MPKLGLWSWFQKYRDEEWADFRRGGRDNYIRRYVRVIAPGCIIGGILGVWTAYGMGLADLITVRGIVFLSLIVALGFAGAHFGARASWQSAEEKWRKEHGLPPEEQEPE